MRLEQGNLGSEKRNYGGSGLNPKGPLVLRIGLDDTDHPLLGCTTSAFDELITLLLERIPDAEVHERALVRLWPFAERRTRGNGALSAQIIIDGGQIGEFRQSCQEWFEGVLAEVSEHPPSKVPAAPVLLVSEGPVPEEWYWETVSGHVDLEPRLEQVRADGCWMLSGERLWGVVGASAAIAWIPNPSSTWELIAWREPGMIGLPRQVTSESVRLMERSNLMTFVNRDPTAGRGLIAPRTPCPVLYGIRGATSESVVDAHRWMQARTDVEKSLRWAVHRTNQLSDDHLGTVSYGTVINRPEEIKGAHSNVAVSSNGDRISLVAFSEGGPVNRLLRRLQVGDRVAWLGLIAPDGSVHLERLSLLDPTPRVAGRPQCCEKSMRSGGAGQQLRCRECGSKTIREWVSTDADVSDIEAVANWSEPSPSNRRHLSRPLELGLPET